jgi:hypothetical protein
MNLRYAKRILKAAHKLTDQEQYKSLEEIMEAFTIFCKSKPNQAEFAEHANGLVLCAELIYITVKEL